MQNIFVNLDNIKIKYLYLQCETHKTDTNIRFKMKNASVGTEYLTIVPF